MPLFYQTPLRSATVREHLADAAGVGVAHVQHAVVVRMAEVVRGLLVLLGKHRLLLEVVEVAPLHGILGLERVVHLAERGIAPVMVLHRAALAEEDRHIGLKRLNLAQVVATMSGVMFQRASIT